MAEGLCGKSFVLKKILRPEGENRGKMKLKDDVMMSLISFDDFGIRRNLQKEDCSSGHINFYP